MADGRSRAPPEVSEDVTEDVEIGYATSNFSSQSAQDEDDDGVEDGEDDGEEDALPGGESQTESPDRMHRFAHVPHALTMLMYRRNCISAAPTRPQRHLVPRIVDRVLVQARLRHPSAATPVHILLLAVGRTAAARHLGALPSHGGHRARTPARRLRPRRELHARQAGHVGRHGASRSAISEHDGAGSSERLAERRPEQCGRRGGGRRRRARAEMHAGAGEGAGEFSEWQGHALARSATLFKGRRQEDK